MAADLIMTPFRNLEIFRKQLQVSLSGNSVEILK